MFWSVLPTADQFSQTADHNIVKQNNLWNIYDIPCAASPADDATSKA